MWISLEINKKKHYARFQSDKNINKRENKPEATSKKVQKILMLQFDVNINAIRNITSTHMELPFIV